MAKTNVWLGIGLAILFSSTLIAGTFFFQPSFHPVNSGEYWKFAVTMFFVLLLLATFQIESSSLRLGIGLSAVGFGITSFILWFDKLGTAGVFLVLLLVSGGLVYWVIEKKH